MYAIDASIAVIVRTGKVLITQRKDEDTFGGFWEFPGGKREEGETLHQALHREMREELDIVVHPTAELTPVTHKYKRVTVTLHPFVCDYPTGEPTLIECQAYAWVEPADLRTYRFPPANESLIEEVIAWVGRNASV